MAEADIIAQLRRFATDPAARALADDAAVLGDLVLTHDTIVEGVHFLPFDPPASVGWKLVAVNLSDLAAKGATPAGALLSMTLAGDDAWDADFLAGVIAACESYRLPLLGGDTVALPPAAARVLGMTAIGRSVTPPPSRAGGRAGDRLYLVGTLGDAGLGLAILAEQREAAGPLVDIYRRPVPLLAAGQAIAPHARAMMDVSDGLLLDARRLAEASGCQAIIDLDVVPLSRAFIAERGQDRAARLFAATAGDDYALLAALPAELDPFTLSLPSGTSMTAVGCLADGRPSLVLTAGGAPVALPETLGFEHRGPAPAPMADRP